MKCCIHAKATAELQKEISEELKKADPTKCCISSIIKEGQNDEASYNDSQRKNKDNK